MPSAATASLVVKTDAHPRGSREGLRGDISDVSADPLSYPHYKIKAGPLTPTPDERPPSPKKRSVCTGRVLLLPTLQTSSPGRPGTAGRAQDPLCRRGASAPWARARRSPSYLRGPKIKNSARSPLAAAPTPEGFTATHAGAAAAEGGRHLSIKVTLGSRRTFISRSAKRCHCRQPPAEDGPPRLTCCGSWSGG